MPASQTPAGTGGEAPLVSIGMPAYNSERFVQQSVRALLDQDLTDFELLVSDDGSSDQTVSIIRAVADGDQRVSVTAGPRRGERQNFNAVLMAARGKYFVWAADHDLWAANYLSACVAALEQDPDVVLAYAQSAGIDADGGPLGTTGDAYALPQGTAVDRYLAQLWSNRECTAIYGVMRRDAIQATGGYADVIGPDNLVLAQMALRGKFALVNETLFLPRRNRPPETEGERRRRQERDLRGRATSGVPASNADYYRPLLEAHLATLAEWEFGWRDRARAYAGTLARFEVYGVPSRRLQCVRIGARLMPKRLRTRGWRVLGAAGE